MKAKKKNTLEVRQLTGFFAKDWPLKIMSLLLAAVLWYFVGGEDRIDKNVMVPIEVINLPRDLVISNQFKKEIEVTVNGPRALIMDMANRAVTRQVDLSAATPGTMVIDNDNNHIPVPRGVTVERVQPSSIILSLDKLIQKQFPVTPRTIGEVARGFRLDSLKTDPDVITITGPQTTLSQFDELYTKTLNLDGLKQTQQIQVPLELEPAIVELIGETSVTVDVVVKVETVITKIEGLTVDAVFGGNVVDIEPKSIDVIAKIPKILLEQQVDPKSLVSVMLAKEESDNTFRIKALPRPGLELPVEVVSVIPPVVTVVTKKKTKENSRQSLNEKSSSPKVTAVNHPLQESMSYFSTDEDAAKNSQENVIHLKRNKEKKVINEE